MKAQKILKKKKKKKKKKKTLLNHSMLGSARMALGELELELHHFIPNLYTFYTLHPPVIPFLSVLIGVHIP
ncbi:hypothetical protein VN97_g6843 [Penicillium thymicola]|uniref:Uncharacterized protein n=1 Tax=Penicillium thymicola TaxID=293382 RepID=A0AAI9TFM0_PENTH|nr:hypothetical protein VN97_g6843 [Penicillium thymicola]